MAITVSGLTRVSEGNKWKIFGKLALDASYATGGYSLTAAALGLDQIQAVSIGDQSAGYTFDVAAAADGASATIKVYSGGLSAFTPAGTNATTSGGTPAGTLTASTALDLATPVFSGTGGTAAGQVITTTDNQTMTLNQCAGMWLIQATGATPPNLILSNTAVVGAPAVLTVQGAANTDAGAYKIVKSIAQVFSGSALAAHGHAFTGTPVVATAASEVGNGTNLSAVTAVDFEAIGL